MKYGRFLLVLSALVVVGGILVFGPAMDLGGDETPNPSPPGDDGTDSGGETDSTVPGVTGSHDTRQRSSGPPVDEATEDARESFLFHPPEGCVSNASPRFTVGFMEYSRIEALNPIGDPGGGSPGRSYIPVTDGDPVPIHAPTAGIIDGITYADRGGGIGEYGVSFWATCEVHILFDHMNDLPDWLKEYAPTTPANHTSTGDVDVHLPIEAGTVIGLKEGGGTTLDFLLLNAEITVEYINPDRFEWDQSLHADCPYDYFADELKAQYDEKLGIASDEGLVPAQDCGSPSHDVADTASGAWFIGENSTEFDGKYLQVARYVNQARIIVKDDSLSNREDARFSLRVYTPERYPAEIGVGEAHCYERHPGEEGAWAYLRVLPGQRLSLAYDTNGGCPDQFPQAQAETWVR